MTGYLTTHVLDTARGCPANGIRIELFRLKGDSRQHLVSLVTNDDGRTDQQILPEDAFEPGTYELVFHAGEYLDAIGVAPETPRFLDVIPIRFGMSEATHYHVPLLLSPFGYSHLSRQLKRHAKDLKNPPLSEIRYFVRRYRSDQSRRARMRRCVQSRNP